jgi:hypothetical protein
MLSLPFSITHWSLCLFIPDTNLINGTDETLHTRMLYLFQKYRLHPDSAQISWYSSRQTELVLFECNTELISHSAEVCIASCIIKHREQLYRFLTSWVSIFVDLAILDVFRFSTSLYVLGMFNYCGRRILDVRWRKENHFTAICSEIFTW